MPPQEEKNFHYLYLILDNYDSIEVKYSEDDMDEIFKLVVESIKSGNLFNGDGMVKMTLPSGDEIENVSGKRVIGYRQ